MTDLHVKPKVLNRSHAGLPVGSIYVGRPSKWGNPFRIGQVYQGRKLSRVDAVEAYRDWLLYSDKGLLLSQREELKGKDLVCWCAPLPCHADVLLEEAND